MSFLTGAGRLSRPGYYWTMVLLLFGLIVALRSLSREHLWFAFVPLAQIYHSTLVRRLHDIGRSGWWVLLAPRFAASVGFIPGDPHPNAYGPRPAKIISPIIYGVGTALGFRMPHSLAQHPE